VTDRLLQSAMALLDSMPAGTDPEVMRQHRLHAGRWWVSSLQQQGKTAEARARAETLLADWDGRTPPPNMAFLLASLRHELIRMAMHGSDIQDVPGIRARAERELDLAAGKSDFGDDVLNLRVRIAMDHAEYRRNRGDREQFVPELAKALAAIGEHPTDRELVALRAILLNRIAAYMIERGDLDGAAAYSEAARATLAAAAASSLPPEWLSLRAHASWGLGRVEFNRNDWEASAPLLAAARDDFDRHTSAFPDDALGLANFGALLTEFAQVEEQRGADMSAVIAMLERGRVLFRRAAAIGAAVEVTTGGRRINLAQLSERYSRRQDGTALAGVGRELAAASPGDAQQQSMAAWRLLQAAALVAARGDEAAAKACDDDALAALQACDRAGWFPPVNLADAPCQRLAGRPEFDLLRTRHPPEQVRRR
jgi:hypothetical protein